MLKLMGEVLEGGSRFGWMDEVKRALNDRRMDMREASERARNRSDCDAVLIWHLLLPRGGLIEATLW